MSAPPPFATVSVDVDPVDLHLLGYGFRYLPPDRLVYTHALPRLLEVFERCGVRATFFVVGRDAEACAALLKEMTDAGHEVASHSQSHPFAFARLSPERMQGELTESRRVLERATGAPVLGFRAPNFDLDDRAAKVLLEAGYRYDASGYPTPLLLPARMLLALKSRNLWSTLKLRSWPFTLERRPYRWASNGGTLVEFPISVTPAARIPVYHTTRYLISDRRFARMLDGFARRGEPLSYSLHAVDALGLVEDPVDRRFAPHPGMNLPLDAKLDLLERSLRAITERFPTQTFAQRLAGFEMA